MKYQAPETFNAGGGNWLSEPGTYHLIVTGVDEEATTKDGKVLDAFRVSFEALEGTTKDKHGDFTGRKKTCDLLFWNPKLTDKNEGEFARKKQGRFMLATGLLDEGSAGKEVEINLESAIGRQVIATLEQKEGKDDRKFLDLHFADIFHIDDPAGSKFPMCKRSLGLIPKSHHRDPKSFGGSSNGDGAANEAGGGSTTDDDLGDL